jgi:DNA integrity scanning protein DisA with diadenylate cyclase activity
MNPDAIVASAVIDLIVNAIEEYIVSVGAEGELSVLEPQEIVDDNTARTTLIMDNEDDPDAEYEYVITVVRRPRSLDVNLLGMAVRRPQ